MRTLYSTWAKLSLNYCKKILLLGEELYIFLLYMCKQMRRLNRRIQVPPFDQYELTANPASTEPVPPPPYTENPPEYNNTDTAADQQSSQSLVIHNHNCSPSSQQLSPVHVRQSPQTVTRYSLDAHHPAVSLVNAPSNRQEIHTQNISSGSRWLQLPRKLPRHPSPLMSRSSIEWLKCHLARGDDVIIEKAISASYFCMK